MSAQEHHWPPIAPPVSGSISSSPLPASTGGFQGGGTPSFSSVDPGPLTQSKPDPDAHRRHVGVVMFHMGTKASLVVTYLLCELFNNGEFVVNFVLVAILQAVDFWYTKNVSGRKLVGLRYWNHTNEAGENEWKYEGRDEAGMAALVADEKYTFWLTTVVTPIFWSIFAFISLLKLSLGYFMLCTMGICTSGANVYGFYKSSSEAKAQLNAGIARYGMSAMRSGWMGSAVRGST